MAEFAIVLTVVLVLVGLYYALVGAIIWAIVLAIFGMLQAAWLIAWGAIQFLFWLITRPIIWPIRFLGRFFSPEAPLPANPVPAQANAASQLSPQPSGKTDQLLRLKTLLDRGVLTQAEFDRAKAKLSIQL